MCVTLPRRSIVRERAGSAASARRQGRCDGCIFMAGIISKNQPARQVRRRGATRRRRVSACSQVAYCLCQLSKNGSSPPSEKKPFYIIPDPEATRNNATAYAKLCKKHQLPRQCRPNEQRITYMLICSLVICQSLHRTVSVLYINCLTPSTNL